MRAGRRQQSTAVDSSLPLDGRGNGGRTAYELAAAHLFLRALTRTCRRDAPNRLPRAPRRRGWAKTEQAAVVKAVTWEL